MTVLFWLLVGHAVADYPLQGDFLSKGKNHKNPIPGIPFWQCLFAHAAIHAGSVALVTGSIAFGLVEFALHCVIDFGKCSGWYGFNCDQGLHVICKVAYAMALMA